jgi:hypothetical protein
MVQACPAVIALSRLFETLHPVPLPAVNSIKKYQTRHQKF